jgi:DNA-3-methyladenine glycosylase
MGSLRHHPRKSKRSQETVWSKRTRAFDFRGPTIDVAQRLVGAILIRTIPEGDDDAGEVLVARIVETEAYLPYVDPACHAYRGPTARNVSAFGRPGTAYVYFIYGNHFCLNVATEPAGVGAAVLIRAAEPLVGVGAMRHRRPGVDDDALLSGPGNLCKSLAIDRRDDGVDLAEGRLRIVSADTRGAPPGTKRPRVSTSARIGLSTATRWPLRFYDAESTSVSPYRKRKLVKSLR